MLPRLNGLRPTPMSPDCLCSRCVSFTYWREVSIFGAEPSSREHGSAEHMRRRFVKLLDFHIDDPSSQVWSPLPFKSRRVAHDLPLSVAGSDLPEMPLRLLSEVLHGLGHHSLL